MVLAAMGLTVSDAVRLLLTRVAHEKVLPFALLDHQLLDLRVELPDLALMIPATVLDPVREHLPETLDRLALPGADLVRVNLVLRRDLLQRPVTPKRLQGDLRQAADLESPPESTKRSSRKQERSWGPRLNPDLCGPAIGSSALGRRHDERPTSNARVRARNDRLASRKSRDAPAESGFARPGSRKLSFVRNQEEFIQQSGELLRQVSSLQGRRRLRYFNRGLGVCIQRMSEQVRDFSSFARIGSFFPMLEDRVARTYLKIEVRVECLYSPVHDSLD